MKTSRLSITLIWVAFWIVYGLATIAVYADNSRPY
jgi:hypothetical protein